MQEAQEYFLKAQQLAEQISAQYGEQELLSRVLINLSIIYTARQDYDKALEIISSSEEIVKSAPSQATVLYFTLAESMAAANRMQAAVQYGRKSLDAMLETDNQQMIGRAYANLGWYEYCNFNYEAARTLLEQSLESTTGEYDTIYVLKRLAKVLIGQKANREAEAVIRNALGMEALVKYPEKEGRLLILLSKASRVPHYAEKVAYNLKYSMNVRFLAYRFLTHYYKRRSRSGQLARTGVQRSFSKRRFLIDKNI